MLTEIVESYFSMFKICRNTIYVDLEEIIGKIVMWGRMEG
jgi:hypothetical protein